jgi:enolase-phosphatase E1
VSLLLDEAGVRCLLLDVEGTTTPFEFVFRTLFPYARERVDAFLRKRGEDPDVRKDIESLRAEQASDAQRGLKPPGWQQGSAEVPLESACRYFRWLMDQDRKSTALKALQGRIWEEGYHSGELRGDVFPDVPPALSRWHKRNKKIAIFSSGSILAQKLLFKTTPNGDLTSLISAHFDTTTGAKVNPESYRRIGDALGFRPSEIAFISDTVAELDAASKSGAQTLLCRRPGRPHAAQATYPIIYSFDDVLP